MAATFQWCQDLGSAINIPPRGASRAIGSVIDCNWKNSNSFITAYSDYPIVAGHNSYTMYIYAKFSGTFNQILNAKWAHTAGVIGTGITLMGRPHNFYVTPATAVDTALSTDMTSVISIGSGATVLFSTIGPEDYNTPTSTLAATGYSQYLATQIQSTTSAAPGDMPSVTFTLQYDEN